MKLQCKCGATLEAPDALRGKRVKCPACGDPLSVPDITPSNVASNPLFEDPIWDDPQFDENSGGDDPLAPSTQDAESSPPSRQGISNSTPTAELHAFEEEVYGDRNYWTIVARRGPELTVQKASLVESMLYYPVRTLNLADTCRIDDWRLRVLVYSVVGGLFIFGTSFIASLQESWDLSEALFLSVVATPIMMLVFLPFSFRPTITLDSDSCRQRDTWRLKRLSLRVPMIQFFRVKTVTKRLREDSAQTYCLETVVNDGSPASFVLSAALMSGPDQLIREAQESAAAVCERLNAHLKAVS